MSRPAYPGIRWDKIARLVYPRISQDNNSRLSYPGISLQRHSCHMFHSSPRLAASLLLLVLWLLFQPPLYTWKQDHFDIRGNQGYHRTNWETPGYPWLVTCGAERVGTGATPSPLQGEHIRLIFIKYWEKTSLYSLSHRGCHCRTPPARRCSHPSKTVLRHTPTCSS